MVPLIVSPPHQHPASVTQKVTIDDLFTTLEAATTRTYDISSTRHSLRLTRKLTMPILEHAHHNMGTNLAYMIHGVTMTHFNDGSHMEMAFSV